MKDSKKFQKKKVQIFKFLKKRNTVNEEISCLKSLK